MIYALNGWSNIIPKRGSERWEWEGEGGEEMMMARDKRQETSGDFGTTKGDVSIPIMKDLGWDLK